MKHMHGLDVDPVTDIVICCGQTEAFAATMFASMFKIVVHSSLASGFRGIYLKFEFCFRSN